MAPTTLASDAKTKVDEAQRQLKAQLVARGSEEIEPLRKAIEQAQDLVLDEPEGMRLAIELLRELEETHKPLTFTDVSRGEMEKLQSSASREEVVAALIKCMGLQTVGGYQSEVLVEYHYHNFGFCQQARLCPEKASTFLSIMKVLHTRSILGERHSKKHGMQGETPLPSSEAKQLFEDLLARHSRQLPPYSVGVFSPDEADLLRAFAERSFFRHYQMYCFMYVLRQDLSVRSTSKGFVPLVPPSHDLKKLLEIDPRAVPELQHLFASQPALASPCSQTAEVMAGGLSMDDPVQGQETQAPHDEVAAHIDNVIQAHWGSLDDRFQLPD